MHTPIDVHHGYAAEIRDHRASVLEKAYMAHPERFVRHPVPPALPTTAWDQPARPGREDPASKLNDEAQQVTQKG